MALNKVMLIGNVGADPEVRYLEGNAKVASIRLATTERYTTRTGEAKEQTEWHNISAWRNLADLAEKYIKKGSQIYVEGRIRTREYTDQSGVKKYRTEIQADNIQLLGRRGEGDSASGYQAPTQPARPAYQQQAPSYQQQAPAYQQAPTAPRQAPVQAPAPSSVAQSVEIDDDLPF